MKLESDTLYMQWRNLTTCCPERCDPRWIDLTISPVSDLSLLSTIEAAQAKPTSYAKWGYDWFITDMSELLGQENAHIVPRIGAGHLALRYQNPVDLEGAPLFFDYFIVPKMSRVTVGYASPDIGFKILKKRGRFRLKSFAKNALNFDLGKLASKMAEEGEDYYRLSQEYDSEIPMPNSKINKQKHNAAESEWLDLNLLAAYQFTKESVQLIYMPIDPSIMVPTLKPETSFWTATPADKSFKMLRIKRTSRKLRIKRRYSAPVGIVAASVLSGEYLEQMKTLAIFKLNKMPAEEFTDTVTDRKLLDDPGLKEGLKEALEDSQRDADYNPYQTFIFSEFYSNVVRSSDPEDETRKTDPNREHLFHLTTKQGFLTSWYVSIFDPISEQFLAKTLEEWQTECIIDEINLLPARYIPKLLLRGLTADQIIYLSAHIGEGTPDTQIETIVNEFLTEEQELRLR